MLADKNQESTSLEKLGEFGLIEHLTQNFPLVHESTRKGIGDDAQKPDHNFYRSLG